MAVNDLHGSLIIDKCSMNDHNNVQFRLICGKWTNDRIPRRSSGFIVLVFGNMGGLGGRD